MSTASITEQEERAIALARMMDAEQFDTWVRLGHALLDRHGGEAQHHPSAPLQIS